MEYRQFSVINQEEAVVTFYCAHISEMSEADYQKLIGRMVENTSVPMISSDTGLEAAQKIGELATKEEIEWAVAGGLAMYIYGSPRLTKDLDIIASQTCR